MSATVLNMPKEYRAASVVPSTFDPERLTVELVWSTGARVRRFDMWRERFYLEELPLDAEAVDMTRLNSGAAPVLDTHDGCSLAGQIGVVERAWLADGKAHALVRLSARESLAELRNDIRDGVIRNISVGYSVQRMEVSEPGPDVGEMAVYRATAWCPYEISFVPIGADPGAQTRAAPDPAQGSPCEFVRAAVPAPVMPREVTMSSTDDAAQTGTQNPAPAPAPDPMMAAAERSAAIAELAARHGLSEHVPAWLRAGHDVDVVRGLILDQLAARDAASASINRVSAGVDESDRRRAAVENALLARAQVIDIATGKPTRMDGANPVRGMSLLELARDSLERGGTNTRGMDKLTLAARAFTQTTSDFPVLLESTMHRALQASYSLAADTWTRFCRQGSVSDFRAHNRYRVGSIGNLDVVNEAGEFTNKPIPDGERGSITARTRGNIVNVTRQVIINDDLDAFLGLAGTLGRAAKRTVEAEVYAYLASNPVLADGHALFSNEHGNLESASAVTVASVNAARIKLASQRDVGGHDFLGLTPAIWLGSLTHGADARVVNSAEYDPDATNKLTRPNVVRGLFRDVVDTPRITSAHWYLFADPAEAPVIEVAFLDGQTEPFLDSQEGFDVDGVRWKVRLDYGVAAIDYRGAVRNG